MTDWEAYEAGNDPEDLCGFICDVARVSVAAAVGAVCIVFLIGVAIGAIL